MSRTERQEKLEKLRGQFRAGRIEPDTYVRKALKLQDGNDAVRRIMRGDKKYLELKT